MNEDLLKFRTSVKPDLMRKTLLRGSLIGGLGIFLLAGTGVFLPVYFLSQWGIPIFLLAMGLIAFGMIPYRKLTLLEKNPNEIIISSRDYFIYRRKGKVILSLPLSSINTYTYIDDESVYGIKISLKNGKEFFLPYFTERTMKNLAR